MFLMHWKQYFFNNCFLQFWNSYEKVCHNQWKLVLASQRMYFIEANGTILKPLV